MNRRSFLGQSLFGVVASAALSARTATATALTSKERVSRALAGHDVDRPPFSFWHHFGLKTASEHASRTLEFHARYHTDWVKVMSDFPYPKPDGPWYELKLNTNPFPDQIQALTLIREGLGGKFDYIETVFNSWTVAQKLSSKEDLLALKEKNPTAVLHALDIITRSQIEHAKRALAQGASGILYAVANANEKELSVADYEKFSEPFDRQFLKAIEGAKFNILHVHVEEPYLAKVAALPAPVFNYSEVVSKIPIAEVRKKYPGRVIAGGIDEVKYTSLSEEDLKTQWKAAQAAAGKKFILTPGCSVPNDSSEQALLRLPEVLKAV